jgi:DNA-binding MarR family transcriptional regulator
MRLEDELKMVEFESPAQRAMLNLIFTNYWIGDRMNQAIKPFDISAQQFNVLRILRGQKGKSLNLMDIQSRMIQKTSNVTRLVEKLRLKSLVERVPCEDNRRKVEITITHKGLQTLETLEPIFQGKQKEIFANLSDEESKQLSTLLDKLRG